MPFNRGSRRTIARHWLRITHNEQIILLAWAPLLGAIVGYGALGFRLAIGEVQNLFYGFRTEQTVTLLAELPWWHLLLAPAVGGLVIGAVLRYLMPEHRSLAVSDAIEASQIRASRVSLREGLMAAMINATSLGVGASLGREGPVVHLGAALGSVASRYLRLPRTLAVTLLGCGVAAAVAASFNAPIAGVFFSLEVVLGSYALRSFAPIVIASVAGTLVSRAHIGDFPAFSIPDYAITSFWEFPAFALLGLVSGIVAVIFMWSLTFAEDVAERIKIPLLLMPASGGLLIGAIAIVFPHVVGVGYEATDMALREQLPLYLLLALIVLKTAAAAICYGARFGGGVFSPSLFVGAMTGGAYGIIAAGVFPELAASHGAYAIIGMGAVAAGVLGAPISTILIVFELTGDYKMSIAVMVAAVIASVVARRIVGGSFFQWQLTRRGVTLGHDSASEELERRSVREVMRRKVQYVHEDASAEEVRTLLEQSPSTDFVVIDREGHLVGHLDFSDVKQVIFAGEADAAATAGVIAHRAQTIVEAQSSLKEALDAMTGGGEDSVAVIDPLDDNHVVGVLHYRDLLMAYNAALIRSEQKHKESQ
ncbi:chloride channel protein [Oceanibacterium hippocampi]|uniref:H(+)/Cl(-) exchange transporter ClcA n=1 Tax=Oceanibacterium hippocampi TaxID=745714 RepID=A0A1Y5SCF0_9PROT|nr:chloride channel protein [Oceanibacterium hippocampi]SLN37543.1 H(+)/Cl(-) exchange transporter ClcA [Oceanibacterium hippocampi]